MKMFVWKSPSFVDHLSVLAKNETQAREAISEDLQNSINAGLSYQSELNFWNSGDYGQPEVYEVGKVAKSPRD